MKRNGFSLVEILIAAVILVIVGIPMIGVFLGSKDAIVRTDAARDNRYFITEILAHAERQSLHELWDNFGPNEVIARAGRMKHEIALYDEKTGKLAAGNPNLTNPLGFQATFLQELARNKIKAYLHFEFYTRKDLDITPQVPNKREPDVPSVRYGILHMQAGYATVQIVDLNKVGKVKDPDDAVMATWQQPIMCPAVVGRPGMKLSSCPAVDRKVRDLYLPLLRQREAAL